MANPANETVLYPFSAFNFSVEIELPGIFSQMCNAAFAECDGLEMTQEVKTIREGGNNGAQIRLPGPYAYGQLTLKRGMTASFDLWDWFGYTLASPETRATIKVVIFAPDGVTERVRFVLTGCLPTKVKAPALNAKDGMVAIEELQVVYETLELVPPSGGQGSPSGLGSGAGSGFGASASFSASASIGGGGASASASANLSFGGS